MSSIDPQSVRSSFSPFPNVRAAQQEQSPTSLGQGMPKKRRRRMNKDQLAQLEHAFAVDRSPTGPRRRELSLQIGAPERQVQVWFQNRRAKAKNNEEKCKRRVLRVPSPVKEPPELRQAVQTELAMLIQEDDPQIFTFPCSTLSIGAWSRVNFEDRRELLAWICKKKRCLVWFIHSKDYSFKMQLPLDDLKEILFKNADPGNAYLTIDISTPPSFFLRRNNKGENGVLPSVWRQCEDWTENKVASRTLRHILGGPALPLAHVVTYIKNQMEDTKEVHLYPVNDPVHNTCPLPTSATSTHPPPSADCGFIFSPAGRQLATRSWESRPCPENQSNPLYNTKPQLHPFQTYATSTSGALGLQGVDAYPDSQVEHDKRGMNGMSGASPDHPSPLLVPLKAPYSHITHHPYPHHATPGYHPFLSLPGVSELFAPFKDFQ